MKIRILLFSALVLSSFLSYPKNVLADEFHTSNGILSIEEGTSDGIPKYPYDPSIPVKPIDSTGLGMMSEGTSGALTIDFVSNFNFGTQVIQSTTQEYFAQEQTFEDRASGPNYVQVTDTRGTASGWTLTVKQLHQFQTLNDEELTGAVLKFHHGFVESTVDQNFAPFMRKNWELISEVESIVTEASTFQGMGTWLSVFGDSERKIDKAVLLEVPGNAVKLKKEYRTKLVWTLKDVPTSGVPN